MNAIRTPHAALGAATPPRWSAFAQHADPFLGWQQNGAPLSLRAALRKPVSFQMAIPGVASWADANVGRFVVRLAGGTQETLPIDLTNPVGLVTYQFPSAGSAMLMFCAGPKVGAGADAWQRVSHCTKMIVRVEDARLRTDDGADADVTSAAGLPLEVVPLVSPLRLKVGSELPARFKYLNRKQAGIDVAALRPDGSIDEKVTDPAGVANFQLSQSGRWLIRFVQAEPDGEHVGELVFEITESGR